MRTTALILMAAALAVSACANDQPIGQGFGDSVRHNMAVHIINPRPKYSVNSGVGFSGPRAAGAIERYETGKVENLRIEKTSKKATAE